MLDARGKIGRHERFKGRRDLIFHQFLGHVRTGDALELIEALPRLAPCVRVPEHVFAERFDDECGRILSAASPGRGGHPFFFRLIGSEMLDGNRPAFCDDKVLESSARGLHFAQLAISRDDRLRRADLP